MDAQKLDMNDAIVAFDPSLTCTGYAVLGECGSFDGYIVSAGTIVPDTKGSVYERCGSILAQCQEIIDFARESVHVSVVQIEMPAEHIRAHHRRSLVTLPNYGILIGCLLFGLDVGHAQIDPVPVTQWSKRAPPAKSTEDSNGSYKIPRVHACEAIYNLDSGALGCKTRAGNVADAILMARWRLTQVKGY